MSGDNPIQNLFKGLSEAMTEGQMPSAKSEWWQSFRFPETPEFSVPKLMNCARSALFGQALAGGPAVHESTFSTSISTGVHWEEKIARITAYVTKELDGRLVYNSSLTNSGELFYVFRGGAILASVSALSDTKCRIQIVGTTKAHMQLGKDLLDTCTKGKDE